MIWFERQYLYHVREPPWAQVDEWGIPQTPMVDQTDLPVLKAGWTHHNPMVGEDHLLSSSAAGQANTRKIRNGLFFAFDVVHYFDSRPVPGTGKQITVRWQAYTCMRTCCVYYMFLYNGIYVTVCKYTHIYIYIYIYDSVYIYIYVRYTHRNLCVRATDHFLHCLQDVFPPWVPTTSTEGPMTLSRTATRRPFSSWHSRRLPVWAAAPGGTTKVK